MEKQREPHPLAGHTVLLTGKYTKELEGRELRVEHWWINVSGKNWGNSDGNPVALQYAMRMGFARGPLGNDVVYGKIGSYGALVHVDELGSVAGSAAA